MREKLRYVGDPHNFGKRVERVSISGKYYFQKPRTVFWEYLFFGLKSPLYQTFNEIIVQSSLGQFITIADCVFGLTFQSLNDVNDMLVEEVQSTNNEPEHDTRFFKFGVLLGYAYAFGIQDLHKDNLVLTAEKIQVIDAEQVLSNLILPDQTLLVGKNNKLNRSDDGLNVFVNTQTAFLESKQFFSILDGYIQGLHLMSLKTKVILGFVQSELNNQKKRPVVRCILRPTSVYKSILKSNIFDRDLLDEEIVQLRRGDIPYFYKYIGENDVYWLVDHFTQVKVNCLKQFNKKTDAVGVDPEILINNERIQRVLIPNGSMFLIRNLLDQNWVGNWRSSDFEINVNADDIEVNYNKCVFKAPRIRK